MTDPQSEFVERYAPRGPRGDKGEQGAAGKQGARGDGLPVRSRRAIAALIVVLFALEGLNLEFTAQYENHTQAAQRRAGLAVEHSICATLGQLAALKPPPGDPATNPSRAFDDRLHATLDGLGPDLGCR